MGRASAGIGRLSLTEDLPTVILMVDKAESIRAFLPQVEELVTGGLIILDEVEVVRYAGGAQVDVRGSTHD